MPQVLTPALDPASFPGSEFVIWQAGAQYRMTLATLAALQTGLTFTNGILAGFTGLQFPATQVPSANPNTLDDYEEGTWTPTFTVGGSGAGVTYTTQAGRYTKIGRLVTVEGELLLSNNGTNTGACVIASLPFTVGISNAASIVGYSGFTGLTAGIQGIFTGGTGTIELRAPATTGTTSVQETFAGNTARFFIGGSYSV